MKLSDIITEDELNKIKRVEESVTGVSAIATSMGSGNGFVNGGPGVLKRAGSTKKKRAKSKKA